MRRIPELEELVITELEYVHSLPQSVWVRLSHVYRSALHWPELRTEVLTACHTSLCFFARRVFKVARNMPWCLSIGNVEENVEELLHNPHWADEPISRNICKLGELVCDLCIGSFHFGTSNIYT